MFSELEKIYPVLQLYLHELDIMIDVDDIRYDKCYLTITLPANLYHSRQYHTLEVFANYEPTGISAVVEVMGIDEELRYYDILDAEAFPSWHPEEGGMSTIRIRIG